MVCYQPSKLCMYVISQTTGNECVCSNALNSRAGIADYGSCNIPCEGNGGENCGGTSAIAVYTIVSRGGGTSSSSTTITSAPTLLFPSPTTTGPPNCYDRSPYDGTVNGGYLILCNTDLSGNTLAIESGNSLYDCIQQCNSFPPEQYPGRCAAVEYDIVSPSYSTNGRC